MPQRNLRMNNDGLNVAISTGGGLAAYLTTLSMLVPILWALYVLILIAIKLPELYDKNVLFRRCVDRMAGMIGWGGRRGS